MFYSGFGCVRAHEIKFEKLLNIIFLVESEIKFQKYFVLFKLLSHFNDWL